MLAYPTLNVQDTFFYSILEIVTRPGGQSDVKILANLLSTWLFKDDVYAFPCPRKMLSRSFPGGNSLI